MRRSVSVSRLCFLYYNSTELYYIVHFLKSLRTPYFIGVYKIGSRQLPYAFPSITLRVPVNYPTIMVYFPSITLR